MAPQEPTTQRRTWRDRVADAALATIIGAGLAWWMAEWMDQTARGLL